MIPRTISTIAILAFIVTALSIMFEAHVVSAAQTTTTITVTGWNFPSGGNIVNGIPALLYPLFMAELFGLFLKALNRAGDFFITLWLFGCAAGSSFGTMAGQIPIAMTIIAWVLLVVWWWTGGQGEGSGASGDLSLPKGYS